jgi:hypothetical protein
MRVGGRARQLLFAVAVLAAEMEREPVKSPRVV